jgi:hypothetical protein
MQRIFGRLACWWFHHKIERTMALYARGAIRNDRLHLTCVRNRLEIHWRARDIHPWDADLPTEDKERLFEEQLLTDTEAAIFRLFNRLPQIDLIDIQVFHPRFGTISLVGTIHRSALDAVGNLLSVRMRLHQMGVAHWIVESASTE